jgi:hypothetical protein
VLSDSQTEVHALVYYAVAAEAAAGVLLEVYRLKSASTAVGLVDESLTCIALCAAGCSCACF